MPQDHFCKRSHHFWIGAEFPHNMLVSGILWRLFLISKSSLNTLWISFRAQCLSWEIHFCYSSRNSQVVVEERILHPRSAYTFFILEIIRDVRHTVRRVCIGVFIIRILITSWPNITNIKITRAGVNSDFVGQTFFSRPNKKKLVCEANKTIIKILLFLTEKSIKLRTVELCRSVNSSWSRVSLFSFKYLSEDTFNVF